MMLKEYLLHYLSQYLRSGCMRLLTLNNLHDTYIIDFLSIIDLNLSEESTIFTTLKFVINDASNHGQKPIVTFEQPLWHTQMSFLSVVGYVMQNSGIKQIFSLAYAEHSVDKMLSGEGYARAMRAHDLLYTTLRVLSSNKLTYLYSKRSF